VNLSSPIRYWETRRLPYNLVLTGVFLAAILPKWRVVQAAVGGQQLLDLINLAPLRRHPPGPAEEPCR
jgi:hypothetical protein